MVFGIAIIFGILKMLIVALDIFDIADRIIAKLATLVQLPFAIVVYIHARRHKVCDPPGMLIPMKFHNHFFVRLSFYNVLSSKAT